MSQAVGSSDHQDQDHADRQPRYNESVNVDSARSDYEELRRQVTQHSTKSGTHDEEGGFDLEKLLRGMALPETF